MAGNLTKTKRRIASIKSTQKITKAMEMVASVKLKRFRDSFEYGKPYFFEMADQMAYLCELEQEQARLAEQEGRSEPHLSHYQQENKDAKGNLYLLITSDLGLCAGYNSNLFRYLSEVFDKEHDVLAPIGSKGLTHYQREEGYTVDPAYAELGLSTDPRDIHRCGERIKKEFNEGKYRKVIVIYTRYQNSISFIPDMETLLPLDLKPSEKEYRSYAPELLKEEPNALLHALLPSYLASRITAKMVESQLCEQASRRTAMENANDNADELLKTLTIEYNKARQTAITQEIVEVVSGSANAN